RFFFPKDVRHLHEMVTNTRRKFAFEQREQLVAYFITSITKIGVAGIGYKWQLWGEQVSHHLLACTLKQRANNPSVSRGRNPCQSPSSATTQTTEQNEIGR